MQHSLNVKKGEGQFAGKVQIGCGNRSIAPSWEAAKAFARELLRPGLNPSANPHIIDVRVLENGHVDVLLQGSLWFNAAPQDAARIGAAIMQVADLVSQELDHERLSDEQALLARTGAPFGVTSHPRILAEAKLKAEHGRDLRRYVPMPSFRGRTMVGLPVVQQLSPVPAVAARQRAALMTPTQKRDAIVQLERETNDADGK